MNDFHRLIAIGDIHGCLDKLEALIEEIVPRTGDRFVFLGDTIDRGPESPGVIDFLLDFRDHNDCLFLLGNHEAMLIDYLDGTDEIFLLNGGQETLKQYQTSHHGAIPETHAVFFREMLTYYQEGNFIFTHAGLRPPLPLAEQSRFDLLWIRYEFLSSDYDWGKTIVYGHTPAAQPLVTPTRIGLDTGAVFGGCLTACDVLSMTFFST